MFRHPSVRAPRVDQVPALHGGRADRLVPGHPPPRHGHRRHPLRVRLPDAAGAARLVGEHAAEPRAPGRDPGLSGHGSLSQTEPGHPAHPPLGPGPVIHQVSSLPPLSLRGVLIIILRVLLMFSLYGEF